MNPQQCKVHNKSRKMNKIIIIIMDDQNKFITHTCFSSSSRLFHAMPTFLLISVNSAKINDQHCLMYKIRVMH